MFTRKRLNASHFLNYWCGLLFSRVWPVVLTDFFAGRWNRVTDRQRELLSVVAELSNCDEEFTPTEVVDKSKELLAKPFGASHVNQMLSKLSESGLVFKNRHGKYSFAVPLLGAFIRRQREEAGESFKPAVSSPASQG